MGVSIICYIHCWNICSLIKCCRPESHDSVPKSPLRWNLLRGACSETLDGAMAPPDTVNMDSSGLPTILLQVSLRVAQLWTTPELEWWRDVLLSLYRGPTAFAAVGRSFPVSVLRNWRGDMCSVDGLSPSPAYCVSSSCFHCSWKCVTERASLPSSYTRKTQQNPVSVLLCSVLFTSIVVKKSLGLTSYLAWAELELALMYAVTITCQCIIFFASRRAYSNLW